MVTRFNRSASFYLHLCTVHSCCKNNNKNIFFSTCNRFFLIWVDEHGFFKKLLSFVCFLTLLMPIIPSRSSEIWLEYRSHQIFSKQTWGTFTSYLSHTSNQNTRILISNDRCRKSIWPCQVDIFRKIKLAFLKTISKTQVPESGCPYTENFKIHIGQDKGAIFLFLF